MKRYRHVDADGRRYRLDDLTAPRPDSDSGKFEWRGTLPGPGRRWGYRLEQLEEWWVEGRIHTKRDGTPRMDGLKRYLDERLGKPLQDFGPTFRESATRHLSASATPPRNHSRSWSASSRLRPTKATFCWTCFAAARPRAWPPRTWAGAGSASTSRPRLLSWSTCACSSPWGVCSTTGTARTDIPKRTDIDTPVPYRQNKHVLFGQQEGRCNGCRSEFPFRLLEVDHIIPRS